MAEPDTTDAYLDFGDTKFARGIAFSDANPSRPVTVFKHWLEDPQTGRRFLVEACDYSELSPLLAPLEEATFAGLSPSGNPKTLMAQTPRPSSTLKSPSSVLLTRALPQRSPATPRQRPFLIAKLDPSRSQPARPRVTIDYVSLSGFVTNQLFLSDQTYAINSLNLYGSNVLLGGTILKFYSNASITLPSGSLVSLAPVC